ncbi:MAG TPA: transcriptional regulator [Cyanobacteria bacterium UBA9971]|nr:transcriptional regulator [Cyanobacteria bacterium UBA9971]
MKKNSISLDDLLTENLKDHETAKEFLNASLESYLTDGDFEEFGKSIELVIKANNSITHFANEANINRAHLYSLFNNKKKPQFSTIINILSKLGFHLKIA